MKTIEFCNHLASELPKVYALFPQLFIDQARDKLPMFEVPASALKEDLFRLQVINPVLTTPQEVNFKLRLSGVINIQTGELTGMKSKAKMASNEQYVNYTSYYLTIDSNSNLIDRTDFNLLVSYCEFWENNEETIWNTHGGKRISLKPLDNFLCQFSLEERLNPVTQKPTVGIEEIRLRGFTFLDTFSGPATTTIATARKQRAGLEAGEVPQPTRL